MQGFARVPPSDKTAPNRPRYFGSVDMHVRLLNNGRILLKKMSEDTQIRSVATPMLFHPDLHKRNVFVSGRRANYYHSYHRLAIHKCGASFLVR